MAKRVSRKRHFNVGDIVRCIDGGGTSALVSGAEYCVEWAGIYPALQPDKPDYHGVRLKGVSRQGALADRPFMEKRFTLVTPNVMDDTRSYLEIITCETKRL